MQLKTAPNGFSLSSFIFFIYFSFYSWICLTSHLFSSINSCKAFIFNYNSCLFSFRHWIYLLVLIPEIYFSLLIILSSCLHASNSLYKFSTFLFPSLSWNNSFLFSTIKRSLSSEFFFTSYLLSSRFCFDFDSSSWIITRLFAFICSSSYWYCFSIVDTFSSITCSYFDIIFSIFWLFF